MLAVACSRKKQVLKKFIRVAHFYLNGQHMHNYRYLIQEKFYVGIKTSPNGMKFGSLLMPHYTLQTPLLLNNCDQMCFSQMASFLPITGTNEV